MKVAKISTMNWWSLCT